LSWAAPKKDIAPAPLPSEIVEAKKVYLLNGQTTSQGLTPNGNNLAFDALYSLMKEWGKFELVGSPKNADIVIELQYRPYSGRSKSFTTYNTYTHTSQTISGTGGGADFAIVIYDANSKEQLWTFSDACGSAYIVSNQRKEVVLSVGRLVEQLKQRIPQK
jgi:hypothetical protein